MKPVSFLIFDLGSLYSNRYTAFAVGDDWEPIMDEDGRWVYIALNFSLNVKDRLLRTSYFFKSERSQSLGRPISFGSLPQELQRYVILQFHHHRMALLTSMDLLYNKSLSDIEKKRVVMGL
jgi:hypothetical protein